MSTPANQAKQKIRSNKLKTFCTLDTYNINPTDLFTNKQNHSRNTPSYTTQSKGTQKVQTKIKANRTHSKSLHSAFSQSRVKESTPKTKTKRLLSIANQMEITRVKTQYNQSQHAYGFRKIVSELKKKLVFHVQDEYRFEAFKVLKLLHQTSKQQYFTVKIGAAQSKKYTLIRTKDPEIRHRYQMECACQCDILNKLCVEERKRFLKVNKIWKEKKQWMVTIDNYLNTSWTNDQFYLFLSRFKTDHNLLKSLIKQACAAILALSSIGRAHNNLNLESLYFQIAKGDIKPDGTIKLGGLSEVIFSKNKEGYLRMPLLYRTPPQILNFILFQAQQPFDRDFLEQITYLKEGWQTDVWSLGIVVLELLNGGPLINEGSDCSKLISLQKQLLIRYSYLFEKTENNLQKCLCNMLSLNPRNRAHPKQIMKML